MVPQTLVSIILLGATVQWLIKLFDRTELRGKKTILMLFANRHANTIKHTEKQIQQGNVTWRQWAIVWEMALGVSFSVLIHVSTICLWTPLELVAPGVCCLAEGANDLLKEFLKPTENQDKLPQLCNLKTGGMI
jgi:hypothetical protein